MPDFIFENHGSICLLAPMSDAAQDWLDDNVDPDAQHFGRSVVIEPRYVDDILFGIVGDGLSIN